MRNAVFSTLAVIGMHAAFAQGVPPKGATGYLDQLNSLRVECNDKASMWHLQERLADQASETAYRMRGEARPVDSSAAMAAVSELRACVGSSKAKAAEEYKTFAAAEKDEQLKADGKTLFVAFSSYLDALLQTDSLDEAIESREGSAYTQARNSMQADSLLSP